MKKDNASQRTIDEFLAGTQGTRWLFDEATACFVDDAAIQLFEIRSVVARLAEAPKLCGQEKDDLIKKRAAAKRWLIEQRLVLDKKFGDYLRLKH